MRVYHSHAQYGSALPIVLIGGYSATMKQDHAKEVGRRIRAYRIGVPAGDSRRTLAGLAEAAARYGATLTRQRISDYEAGRYLPDLATARALADALEISLDDLMPSRRDT